MSTRLILPKRTFDSRCEQLNNAHMNFYRHAVDGGFTLSSIAVDQAGGRGGLDQMLFQRCAMRKLRFSVTNRQRGLNRVTAPIRDSGGQ